MNRPSTAIGNNRQNIFNGRNHHQMQPNEFRTFASSLDAHAPKDYLTFLKPVLPSASQNRIKVRTSSANRTGHRPASANALTTPFRANKQLNPGTSEKGGNRYFNVPSSRTEQRRKPLRKGSFHARASAKNSQSSWPETK